MLRRVTQHTQPDTDVPTLTADLAYPFSCKSFTRTPYTTGGLGKRGLLEQGSTGVRDDPIQWLSLPSDQRAPQSTAELTATISACRGENSS
ncbi:hypothetical protein OPT61_g4471 [Boeremia exigua]|uniref:Uncharacterized protein n=1 Tax=Boeremia exigua TaxID=749465 RepID=A0ACC2IDZ7_9PLEO|nr:hypothetical protein OPT61_g4471 [Boeremia exigua]